MANFILRSQSSLCSSDQRFQMPNGRPLQTLNVSNSLSTGYFSKCDQSFVNMTPGIPHLRTSWYFNCQLCCHIRPYRPNEKEKGRSPGTALVPSHYCCLLRPRQLSKKACARSSKAGGYPNSLHLKTLSPGPLNNRTSFSLDLSYEFEFSAFFTRKWLGCVLSLTISVQEGRPF